jgi:hypothetical protein
MARIDISPYNSGVSKMCWSRPELWCSSSGLKLDGNTVEAFRERQHSPLTIWKQSPMDCVAECGGDAHTFAEQDARSGTRRFSLSRRAEKRRPRLTGFPQMPGSVDYAGKNAEGCTLR